MRWMQPCHQAVDAIVGGSQVRDNGHNAPAPTKGPAGSRDLPGIEFHFRALDDSLAFMSNL